MNLRWNSNESYNLFEMAFFLTMERMWIVFSRNAKYAENIYFTTYNVVDIKSTKEKYIYSTLLKHGNE